ncbi:MAG TPA: hypothetical protein VFW39_08975 [Sphingomicrobium sp.]|nr:hypothetical protein [Sphingomicrobium sp.]
MRKALILSAFALCASPSVAADTAQCDAKPFTINKPGDQAKKPAGQPKLAQAAPAVAKPVPKPQPKAKPPLLAGCKSGKSKKG